MREQRGSMRASDGPDPAGRFEDKLEGNRLEDPDYMYPTLPTYPIHRSAAASAANSMPQATEGKCHPCAPFWSLKVSPRRRPWGWFSADNLHYHGEGNLPRGLLVPELGQLGRAPRPAESRVTARGPGWTRQLSEVAPAERLTRGPEQALGGVDRHTRSRSLGSTPLRCRHHPPAGPRCRALSERESWSSVKQGTGRQQCTIFVNKPDGRI